MIETYIETRPTGLRAFRCFQSDFQFLAVLWPMSVHLGVTKFLQSSQVAFFFGPCLALVNCTSGAPSTGPWQVALPAGCPKIPWFIVIFHDFSFFFPTEPFVGQVDAGWCWHLPDDLLAAKWRENTGKPSWKWSGWKLSGFRWMWSKHPQINWHQVLALVHENNVM